MRLTFSLLGLELDITFGLATDADPDPLRDLGTTGHQPVGFVRPRDPRHGADA